MVLQTEIIYGIDNIKKSKRTKHIDINDLEKYNSNAIAYFNKYFESVDNSPGLKEALYECLVKFVNSMISNCCVGVPKIPGNTAKIYKTFYENILEIDTHLKNIIQPGKKTEIYDFLVSLRHIIFSTDYELMKVKAIKIHLVEGEKNLSNSEIKKRYEVYADHKDIIMNLFDKVCARSAYFSAEMKSLNLLMQYIVLYDRKYLDSLINDANNPTKTSIKLVEISKKNIEESIYTRYGIMVNKFARKIFDFYNASKAKNSQKAESLYISLTNDIRQNRYNCQLDQLQDIVRKNIVKFCIETFKSYLGNVKFAKDVIRVFIARDSISEKSADTDIVLLFRYVVYTHLQDHILNKNIIMDSSIDDNKLLTMISLCDHDDCKDARNITSAYIKLIEKGQKLKRNYLKKKKLEILKTLVNL